MSNAAKAVRQSVSIPVGIAKRVRALAKKQKASSNRILVDLIEVGLASKEAERQTFMALAAELAETTDGQRKQQLKKELARMTFGE